MGDVILASASEIRARLLARAGVNAEIVPARIDEDAARQALLADGAQPRDVADSLAEAKARKVSLKRPEALVLGCDQVLEINGRLLSKPESPEAALDQLREMRGKRHRFFSAAVACQAGRPQWRHVGEVKLTMREASDAYLADYVERNWESIRWSVGAYKLEEEGVRLITKIEGDHFNVLGLPLLELLSWLTIRGTLPA